MNAKELKQKIHEVQLTSSWRAMKQDVVKCFAPHFCKIFERYHKFHLKTSFANNNATHFLAYSQNQMRKKPKGHNFTSVGKEHNPFLSFSFKQALEKNHTENIKHLYYVVDDKNNKVIGYAQQFNLGGRKISSYQKRNKVNKGLVS
ncbi:hypothetical protein N9Y89_00260 [bacterium]|nr:hypothetical protein [bacterium]